ncbi:L-selectin-like [Labrus mixtus]|uniref:L-selectin-like n=1 Tax=Labrus mixtus TaxID=508554 RepID=UPI0029C02420|nr:L-selectin-like [Labrus mixtus]
MEKLFLSLMAAAGLCAVYTHAGRQFHFVYEPKNMTEALSYCRDKYTDLASIDNMEDVELLNREANLSRMVYSEYSRESSSPRLIIKTCNDTRRFDRFKHVKLTII